MAGILRGKEKHEVSNIITDIFQEKISSFSIFCIKCWLRCERAPTMCGSWGQRSRRGCEGKNIYCQLSGGDLKTNNKQPCKSCEGRSLHLSGGQ